MGFEGLAVRKMYPLKKFQNKGALLANTIIKIDGSDRADFVGNIIIFFVNLFRDFLKIIRMIFKWRCAQNSLFGWILLYILFYLIGYFKMPLSHYHGTGRSSPPKNYCSVTRQGAN